MPFLIYLLLWFKKKKIAFLLFAVGQVKVRFFLCLPNTSSWGDTGLLATGAWERPSLRGAVEAA